MAQAKHLAVLLDPTRQNMKFLGPSGNDGIWGDGFGYDETGQTGRKAIANRCKAANYLTRNSKE